MTEGYGALLKDSWKLLWNNLSLFFPFIWGLVFGMGFAILVGIEALIFILLGVAAPEQVFSAGLLPIAILLVIIDAIVLLVMGSAVTSMWTGLYAEAAIKKKTSWRSCWKFAKKYFWTVLEAKVVTMLLILIPVVVAGLIVAGLFFTVPLLGIVIGIICFMLAILWMVLVSVALLFLYPVIATKRLSGLAAVRYSIRYAKQNLGQVFLTWIIVVAVMVAVSLPTGLLSGVFQMGANFAPEELVLVALLPALFFRFITRFVQAIARVWTDLFVFKSFFSKNKVKFL